MDSIAALHNEARRYCIDRISSWHEAYAGLHRQQRDKLTMRSGELEYSDEARNIFPRYNVLTAILRDIETLVLASFGSADQMREVLIAAASTAQSDFTRSPNNVETNAVQSERQAMCEWLLHLDESQFLGKPLLPYRRALGEAEHKLFHAAFVAKWGKWYGGSVDRKDLPANVTLHTDVMKPSGSYNIIRDTLRSRGMARVVELREFGDGYELELSLATFEYNGAEGFWTAGEQEWMITASHEGSITFGGQWLVDWMRERLPQFDRYIYKGWDSAAY